MTRFLDTNILVYAQRDDPKSDTARAIIRGGEVISVQVSNEFANAPRRTLARSWDEIETAIDDAILLLGPPRPLTIGTHAAATNLARAHALNFHGALIPASAGEAGCRVLLSEDMQAGAVLGAVRVENPFGEPAHDKGAGHLRAGGGRG